MRGASLPYAGIVADVNTELEFQRVASSDGERLLALMREFSGSGGPAFDEDVARRGVRLLLDDERNGCAWFLRAGGETVGYLVLAASFSLEFHGPDAYVDEVYVRDAFRGRGYGTRALERAIEECRAREIAALHLEVDRSNPRARALYEKLGFVDHDRYLMTKWLVEHPAKGGGQ